MSEKIVREIPMRLFKLILIVSFIVIFALVFSSELTISDIHEIYNTYIIIGIAIISVLIVVLSMSDNKQRELIFSHCYYTMMVSFIFEFFNILGWFYSYMRDQPYWATQFTLASITWFNIISILGLLSVFLLFQPELEEIEET